MGETVSRWGDRSKALLPGRITISVVLSLWVALLLAAPCSEVFAMGPVREPEVAGQFYPRDPQALRQAVQGYVAKAEVNPGKNQVVALLSPHAGYMYSGPVAGWTYRQVEGQSFDTVVVLSPSHRVPFRGVSILSKGAYRTPLGDITIDEERCQALLKYSTT